MDLPVRWVLTFLFAVAVTGSCHRMWVAQNISGKIGHMFHAVASLVMLLMIWPGAPGFSSKLQATLFAVASMWFAMGAVRSWRNEGVDGCTARSNPPLVGIYHSFTMLVMLWMASSMTGNMGGEKGAPHSHPMSADDASGTGGMGMATGADHRSISTWLRAPTHSGEELPSAISLVLGAIFVVVAMIWFFQIFPGRGPVKRYPVTSSNRRSTAPLRRLSVLTSVPAGEASMAAGMAIMMLPMS